MQDLLKMSNEELLELNKKIVRILKERRTLKNLNKITTLEVGQKVMVDHDRLRGLVCVIKKINQTKVAVETQGKGTFNVPASMIITQTSDNV